MYLTSRYSGYNRKDEQSSAGQFLIIASSDKPINPDIPARTTLYACVRYVRLTQLGHWMIGVARIANESITVSGAYGNDGLPINYNTLSPKVQSKFVRVPDDVANAYWSGEGGHNSAGSEMDMMREYGLCIWREHKGL